MLCTICQAFSLLVVAAVLVKVLWDGTEHIDGVNEPPSGGRHE